MAVSAGRILILPKGSYDSTTTYEFLDAVYYQGSTYICKKTALNVLPSNTEYWQIMAQGTASASVAGNYYAECDTSASTPAKVITVPATEYFVLQVGDIVNVKFTYTNTATNPTLNINNTGNKTIVYDTSAITSSNLWAGGEAGRITSFMYDGTNWVWISHDVDTNTLSDLLDTTISSPTNKQGLIFNGTSNKWENKTFVAGDVGFDNTGTDLVSNNVNDAIVEVNDKKTNNSNLAPIEATTTASRSYLVGDYLMLQGEFYKVISAIAIGDTLTVGTNIQATSVGDVLTELNENSIKPINYSNRISLLGPTTSYPFTYTATGNGWLNAFRIYKNATAGVALTINGDTFIILDGNTSTSLVVPIRKNDVFVFKDLDTASRAFIYYD